MTLYHRSHGRCSGPIEQTCYIMGVIGDFSYLPQIDEMRGTLRFPKSYVKEKVTPKKSTSTSRRDGINEQGLDQNCSALSWASNCLAVRSHYGWLVCSIKD